jgi:hypothetical protein
MVVYVFSMLQNVDQKIIHVVVKKTLNIANQKNINVFVIKEKKIVNYITNKIFNKKMIVKIILILQIPKLHKNKNKIKMNRKYKNNK